MIPPRKVSPATIGIAAVLLTVPFWMSFAGLLPESRVNCTTYEVDITSGRVRETRYFAFVRVARSVTESGASRALHDSDTAGAKPDWRPTCTYSPGGRYDRSAAFTFRHAMHRLRSLELTWELGKFSQPARRASVKRVLELWQEGQRPEAANRYLEALSVVAARNDREQQTTEVVDLPSL
jgi:hypothetical protein